MEEADLKADSDLIQMEMEEVKSTKATSDETKQEWEQRKEELAQIQVYDLK